MIKVAQAPLPLPAAHTAREICDAHCCVWIKEKSDSSTLPLRSRPQLTAPLRADLWPRGLAFPLQDSPLRREWLPLVSPCEPGHRALPPPQFLCQLAAHPVSQSKIRVRRPCESLVLLAPTRPRHLRPIAWQAARASPHAPLARRRFQLPS